MDKEINKFNKDAFKYYCWTAGVSQHELSEKTKISRTSIRGFERGVRMPNDLQLKRLAKVLHCNVKDLLMTAGQSGKTPAFNKYSLKYYRLSAGLSQKETAKRLNVSASYISYLEKGSKIPTYPLCSKLAQIFDCNVSDFFKDDITAKTVNDKEIDNHVGIIFNGSVLRDYRIKANMTQQELSRIINASPPYINRLESGGATPSKERLQQIANALACPAEDLYRDMSKEQILQKMSDIQKKKMNSRSRRPSGQKETLPFNKNALVHYRLAAGMNQSELAGKIGTSVNAVYFYENGPTKPTAHCIRQIASAIGCSVENLAEDISDSDISTDKSYSSFNGNAFKYYRITAEKTQQEVADAVGLSIMTVSHYENNHSVPSMLHARRIASVLGCSVDNLSENKTADDIRNLKNEQRGCTPLDMYALQYYRIAANMTQKELAAASNLSVSSISHFETGNRTPNDSEIQSIASVLSCSVNNLIEPKTAEDIKRLRKEQQDSIPFNKNALKYYRIAANLTQQGLAGKLQVSRTVISSYEIGTLIPDMASIQKISDVLGCSVSNLSENITEEELKIQRGNLESCLPFNRYALAYYRAAANITQKKLAKMIGTPPSRVINFECGAMKPNRTQLQALADALGCSVESLSEDRSMEDAEQQRKNAGHLLPFNKNALTYYRTVAQLTKQELADEIGSSAAYIVSIESGASSPTDSVIQQAARAIHCTVENLAEGIPPETLASAVQSVPKTRSSGRVTINSSVLSSCRQKTGLTQEELALKMDVPESYIARLESKDSLISIKRLQELASILGCPVRNLMCDIKSSKTDRKPTPKATSLANAVKAHRQRLCLTQSELGNQCGLSENSIADIENGFLIPPKIYLKRLALVFGCPVEALK